MTTLFSDTFTGSGDLAVHVSDSGHTWTRAGGSVGTDAELTGGLATIQPPSAASHFVDYTTNAVIPNGTCFVELAVSVPLLTDHASAYFTDFILGLWGQWNVTVGVISGGSVGAIGSLPTLVIYAPSGTHAIRNVNNEVVPVRLDIDGAYALTVRVDGEVVPGVGGTLAPASQALEPSFQFGTNGPATPTLWLDQIRLFDELSPFWFSHTRSHEVS